MKRQLDFSYNRAPQPVKNLINRLMHDKIMQGPQIRISTFVGEPGTDKTITAIMVASQVADKWGFTVIHCPELTAKGRGAATENLKERLELVEEPKDGRGILTIFEEAQEILDHADDTHYDTDSTGRFLTSWINKNENNPKAYMLFILNALRTSPEQMKSRMYGNIIYFEPLSNSESRCSAFLEQLNLRDFTCDEGVTNELLDNLVGPLNGWTGRDFQNLVAATLNEYQSRSSDLDHVTFIAEDIKKGIAQIIKDKQFCKRLPQDEKDQDQRERHHKDALRMHKENIRANLLMQTRLKDQASGQIGLPFIGGSVTSAPGITLEDAKQTFLDLFPKDNLI